MDLYPHQREQIVNPVRQTILDGFKRVLVVSPTGSGKTICFVHIASGARKKSNRVWILVHRAELVEQTCRSLTAWDCPHGILAAGCLYDDGQLVQVVSVQTLASRLKQPWKYAVPDILVVDEAHHSTSSTWQTVFAAFPSAHVLGFTATPQRLDGKGLAGCFDKMIIGPEPEWLMANGYLTRPIYYGVPPSQLPDLKGLAKTGGDFSKSELALAMEAKPTITGDVVAHYQRRANGVPFIGFAVNLEHAGKMASAFVAAGIPCEVIHGALRSGERAAMVARLKAGEIKGLWSVDLVAEGFDLPAVGCAILCRPTDSLGLHLQQLGRPLRKAEGKRFCVILDHVGNLRHGTAEMRREWTLDGVSRKQRAKEVLAAVCQCPGCFIHLPKFDGPCPNCGHVAEVKARNLKTVKGELKELTASEIDANAQRMAERKSQGMARTEPDLVRQFMAQGSSRSKAIYRARIILRARRIKESASANKADPENQLKKKMKNRLMELINELTQIVESEDFEKFFPSEESPDESRADLLSKAVSRHESDGTPATLGTLRKRNGFEPAEVERLARRFPGKLSVRLAKNPKGGPSTKVVCLTKCSTVEF